MVLLTGQVGLLDVLCCVGLLGKKDFKYVSYFPCYFIAPTFILVPGLVFVSSVFPPQLYAC